MLRLRKYPNRRYYDTSRSQYITLAEIYALIQSGHEIQVSDSKTDEDITAKVLAQIILDLDPPKLCVFSVPLLHRLIRANEQLVTDFVERYINQAMTAFLDSQKTLEQSIRQTMGLATPAALVPEWMQMLWDPMRRGAWPPANPYTAPAAPSAPPPAPPDDPGDASSAKPARAENGADVHALRGEIDELKHLVQGLRAQLSDAKSAPARPARGRAGGRRKP